MTELHVILKNDYPAGIVTSAEAADEFCRKMNETEKQRQKSGYTRVYWKAYACEVDWVLQRLEPVPWREHAPLK